MAEEVSKKTGIAPYITSVSIDLLFGRYSYDLNFGRELSILYGDNGTGKTTILRLIHNLLSPSPGNGHKTAIAQTPFRRLRVNFSNGVTLEAVREQAVIGSFELFLELPRGSKMRAPYIVNDGNVIPRDGIHSEAQDALHEAILAATQLYLYYLSDERVLESDFIEPRPSRSRYTRQLFSNHEWSYRAEIADLIRDQEPAGRASQVAPAISRATAWVRQQVLQGTSEGSANANTIYAEVVQHLVRMPAEHDSSGDDGSSRQELLRMIQSIGSRSKEQSRFGLSPAVKTDDLMLYIPAAREDVFPLISRILKPYLEGTAARLDALEETYKTLSFFVDALNAFLRDKHVDFNVSRGLRISTPEGTTLDPDVLSSGESQLLTLFCNILSARQRPSVFIIDEPEISLNVKWQRSLVKALLGCAAGSSIQLILASHSIELLTAHRDQVVALED